VPNSVSNSGCPFAYQEAHVREGEIMVREKVWGRKPVPTEKLPVWFTEENLTKETVEDHEEGFEAEKAMRWRSLQKTGSGERKFTGSSRSFSSSACRDQIS
jgi:hypothetical protein